MKFKIIYLLVFCLIIACKDNFEVPKLETYPIKNTEAFAKYKEGYKLFWTKDYENAEKALDISFKIEENPNTLVLISDIKRDSNQEDQFVRMNLNIVSNYKDFWVSYLNLINYYLTKNDYSNAENYINLVLENSSDQYWKDVSNLYNAYILVHYHKINEAKIILQKVKYLEKDKRYKQIFTAIRKNMEIKRGEFQNII